MKYQYKSGKIVTSEELREFWNRCNPHYRHDDVEFAMSLYVDIQNGTIKEIEDDAPIKELLYGGQNNKEGK